MLNTKLERRVFDAAKLLEEDIATNVEPRLPLLETREQTHGSFASNAIISQALKAHMRAAPGWQRLTDVEREAMDMIALKFSRMLSGKSMERQHWEDVEGYARLIVEQCA